MKADREILERAVAALAAQAAETDALVREAAELAGGSSPLTIHAKMIRQELLRAKADMERELERLELNCSSCGRRVHWVAGLGVQPATWRTGNRRRTGSLFSLKARAQKGVRHCPALVSRPIVGCQM